MAHLGCARVALVVAALALSSGCYQSHGRTESAPAPPAVDAAPPDAGPPPLDAFVCGDCGCCACGSTGLLCASIGLGSCCAAPRLAVEASFSAATLGDECGEGGLDGDCAPGGCLCARTSMQLRFVASSEPALATAAIEVLAIRLYLDGRLVDELVPGPLLWWSGAEYAPWDGTIASGTDVRASVEASAPDWVAIGGGDPWRTYGMQFRVVVTVSIDGELRDLALEPVIRQSEIDT